VIKELQRQFNHEEEEPWCKELVARVTTAEAAGGLGCLDRHIERVLAERTHEGGEED